MEIGGRRPTNLWFCPPQSSNLPKSLKKPTNTGREKRICTRTTCIPFGKISGTSSGETGPLGKRTSIGSVQGKYAVLAVATDAHKDKMRTSDSGKTAIPCLQLQGLLHVTVVTSFRTSRVCIRTSLAVCRLCSWLAWSEDYAV